MGNLLAHHCQETMLIKWFFRLELAQLGSSGFQGSSLALAKSSWMQIQPEHSPGHSDHTVTPPAPPQAQELQDSEKNQTTPMDLVIHPHQRRI